MTPTGLPPFPARFCLGVTGHRAHRLGDSGRVAETAAALVDRIAGLAAEAAADPAARASGLAEGPPRMVLSGAMADGADQILADAARARGYVLEAILPFPADAYSRPFPATARAAVLALDSDPAVEAVTTLTDLGADASAEAMALAYRRAGELTLARSDLLVTVWDGAPARGPGGTAEIVARARAKGRAVAWIGLDGALLLSSGATGWAKPSDAGLDRAIRARLLPQAPAPDPGPPLPEEDWSPFIAGAARLHGPAFARGLDAFAARASQARRLGLGLAPLLSAGRLPLLIGEPPAPAPGWDDWALRMAAAGVPLPSGLIGPDRLRGILRLAATLTGDRAADTDARAVAATLRRGEAALRNKAPRPHRP